MSHTKNAPMQCKHNGNHLTVQSCPLKIVNKVKTTQQPLKAHTHPFLDLLDLPLKNAPMARFLMANEPQPIFFLLLTVVFFARLTMPPDVTRSLPLMVICLARGRCAGLAGAFITVTRRGA